MDLSSRRRGSARNGVVAGSVWESRMKVDEVKGGIKVFNGEEIPEENSEKTTSTSGNGAQEVRKLRGKQSLVGLSGKRKTWKAESFEGPPIQIARQRSELSKNLDEQYKELSVSADGIKKSPAQIKKTRSELGKELSVSVDGVDRNSIQGTKARSLSLKGPANSVDGSERNSVQLKKAKSDTNKDLDEEIVSNAELRKVKSDSFKALDEAVVGNDKNLSQPMKGKSKNVEEKIERNSVELREENVESEGNMEKTEKKTDEIGKSESNESIKELDVCEEKVMTSSFGNVGQVKSPPLMVEADDHDDDEDNWDDDEEELEEEIDKENEVEKKSVDVKEISTPEQNPKKIVVEEKQLQQRNEKPTPISPIVKKPPSPTVKLHQSNEKSIPISPIAKKQPPPTVNFVRIHPSPTKPIPTSISDDFHRIPRTDSKLQSLVDLVMWRDVSKSAFVFGIGTFLIISSSYTKDLNVSVISVVSYLGLVYLAMIFLFKSIISRGVIVMDDTSLEYVVGEEDAIWVLKLVLPYLNEFLLNLRALFSGDPATTMKLAVLLFVLARCGSSITIWKMAKLGKFLEG